MKEFQYFVVLTANHAFIDGLSVYKAVLQLFKLIEDYDQCRELNLNFTTVSLLPSIESLSAARINDFSKNPLKKRLYEKKTKPACPVLVFAEKAECQQVNLETEENANDVLDFDGNLFLSQKELKTYTTSNRYCYTLQVFVEPKIVLILIRKCKYHDLKFNGEFFLLSLSKS